MKRFSEISKGLAGRYLKKVPASAADAGDKTGRGGMGQAGASPDVKKDYEKQRKSGINQFLKRQHGTKMAVDKLTGKAKVPAKEAVEEGKAYGPTGVSYYVPSGHKDEVDPKTGKKYPERQKPDYKAPTNEDNQRHIDNLKDVIARHQKAHDHHQQMGKEADNRGDAVKHMNAQQSHAKTLKHAKEKLAKLQNEETNMEEKTLSQKDIQKGLAKAARTAKSKDSVTLPKAPWDKEKKNEAVEKEELKGAQHKLDHDKDGKITANDFKGLRKKKEKQETGTVNPKLDGGKSKGNEMEQKESTSIRQKLMSIWEKADAHMKGATPSEPHGQYDSPGGKKMKQDMKADGNPEVGINGKDVEQLGHDDASKAGRAGPNAAKRPNDAKVGDKQIINRVAAAYKEMKSGN